MFVCKKKFTYIYFFFNTHSERLKNCFLSLFCARCTFIIVLFWLPRERAQQSFHFCLSRSFTLFRTSYIILSLSYLLFLKLVLFSLSLALSLFTLLHSFSHSLSIDDDDDAYIVCILYQGVHVTNTQNCFFFSFSLHCK